MYRGRGAKLEYARRAAQQRSHRREHALAFVEQRAAPAAAPSTAITIESRTQYEEE